MRVKDRPGGTSGVACAPLPAICRAAAACAPQRAANRRHLTSTSHASSAALATCAGLGRRHATHAAPYAHGLGLLSARAPRAAPTAPRRWRRTHACPLRWCGMVCGRAAHTRLRPTGYCVAHAAPACISCPVRVGGPAWPAPRGVRSGCRWGVCPPGCPLPFPCRAANAAARRRDPAAPPRHAHAPRRSRTTPAAAARRHHPCRPPWPLSPH